MKNRITKARGIMKKNELKKKSMALFLVIAMAASALAGCGDKKTEEPATEINFADIADVKEDTDPHHILQSAQDWSGEASP